MTCSFDRCHIHPFDRQRPRREEKGGDADEKIGKVEEDCFVSAFLCDSLRWRKTQPLRKLKQVRDPHQKPLQPLSYHRCVHPAGDLC